MNQSSRKTLKHLLTPILAAGLILSLSACRSTSENAAGTSSALASESQVVVASSGSTSAVNTAPKENTKTGSKVLIVYFAVAENGTADAVTSASLLPGSRLGLIRTIADDIKNGTGGDMFSIQTDVDYPSDINTLIDFAAKEQKDNARPKLTTHIENLDQYDTIFIGYPLWWYDLPQVMYSFFDEYDFSGKTIIPFCTHNGSRFSGTIGTIRKLEPKANVMDNGFTVNQSDVAGAAKDVAAWLKKLGY